MFSLIINKLRVYKFRFNIKRHDNIAVLYHHIGEPVGFKSKFHSLDLKTFISQIIFFQKHWKFVTEDVFFEKINNNEKGYAILTFDDGYKDTFNHALPFLETKKIPYLFFVNNCSIENKWMWRDLLRWIIDNNYQKKLLKETQWKISSIELLLQETKNPKLFNSKEIVNDLRSFIQKYPNILMGFEKLNLYIDKEDIKKFCKYRFGLLGNHTDNHYVLSTVSNKTIKNEIDNNYNILSESIHSNKISKSFSMPFGNINTYNKYILEHLKNIGYKYLFISESSSYNKGVDVFTSINGLLSAKRVLPKKYN